MLVPLVVAAVGIALGAGGFALLRPFAPDGAERLTDALTTMVSGAPPGRVMRVTWVSPSGAAHTARVPLSPAPAA
jgi:hypothetical protein